MPDQCFFCGENAVIKEDVDGGSEQNICIECGAIAPEIKHKIECAAEIDDNKVLFESNDHDQICESCGDLLSSQSSSVKLCSECQAVEEEESKNGDNIFPRDSNTVETMPSHIADNICSSCGSLDLSPESIGTEERLVCRACGAVVAGQDFAHDDFEVMTRAFRNNIQTLPKFAQRKQKLRGLEAGHKKIEFLQNKLCFPDIVKDEAVEMFDKVFYKNVLKGHIITKVHIAAACVFIVSRIHDIPVSMTHFIDFVDKFSLFVRGKKFILKCLNIHLPYLPLSSQIEHCLTGHGFDSKIFKQVKDILFLCRKAWLSEGRSREGLIVLAGYYAYLNSDKCSKFISLAVFRKKFNLPPTSRTLQVECRDLFLKLISNIPWVLKKNIKPNTLHLYIDDVLRYQKSLFQLAFKSQTRSLELVLIDKDKSSFPAGNSATNYKSNLVRKSSDSHKDILLPTSMKKPRRENFILETKIPLHIDLDSTEVSASEFEEDEISSYLLTEEEQARVKSLKIDNMTGRKNNYS